MECHLQPFKVAVGYALSSGRSFCWKGFLGRNRNNIIWKMVLSCLIRCIWRERNDWSFEDSERTVKELKDFFLKTLYHRIAAMDLNISSFHVFLDVFSSTI